MGDSVLNNSSNYTPTPKVTAAAVVGSIVVIVTWLVNYIWHADLPVELGSLLNLVLMVGAAYIKRDKVKFN